MNPGPEAPREGSRALIWVAVGCGLLLLLTMCASLGVGAFLFMSDGGGGFDLPSRDGPKPTPPAGPPGGPTVPGKPQLPAPAPQYVPRLVVGTVQNATGSSPVSVGAECRFQVHRIDRPEGGYWCNAQVVCGGRLLYGGPEAGFFPCTFESGGEQHISGSDADTTTADSDAAMSLDTRARSLTIRDDGGGTYGTYSITVALSQ